MLSMQIKRCIFQFTVVLKYYNSHFSSNTRHSSFTFHFFLVRGALAISKTICNLEKKKVKAMSNTAKSIHNINKGEIKRKERSSYLDLFSYLLHFFKVALNRLCGPQVCMKWTAFDPRASILTCLHYIICFLMESNMLQYVHYKSYISEKTKKWHQTANKMYILKSNDKYKIKRKSMKHKHIHYYDSIIT